VEQLDKLETVAALGAVKAVIGDGEHAGVALPDDHPLRTAMGKLQRNLNDFNMEEATRAKR
jgi:hypothetical protein